LNRLFKHFDEENDGLLTEKELRALILGLGIQRASKVPEGEELKRWMAEFDVTQDKNISWDEFREGFKRWVKVSKSQRKKSPAGSPPSESHYWDQEAQVSVQFH